MNLKINKKYTRSFLGATNRYVFWSLLIGITVIFTIILCPNLVIKNYSYNIGDIVERDIKAPKDFFIENRDATQESRRQAVEAVLTVYDHDTILAHTLSRRINEAFADLRRLFEFESASTGTSDKKAPLHDRILQMKDKFEEKMGISVSNGAYKILEDEKFSQNISNLIGKILKQILDHGIVANRETLLKEYEKGIILRSVQTKKEETVLDLKRFYGPDQAKTMVRIIGRPILKDINYILQSLIVDFSQRLLPPNITLNRNETEERKKMAAKEIKPVLYKIKAGEMLLREGERVSKLQLLKLNAMKTQTQNKPLEAKSIGTGMVILCLLLTTYITHIKDNQIFERHYNKNLLFISSILLTFFIITKISASLFISMAPNVPFSISTSSMFFSIPVASGAMTICLFMGLEIATAFAVLMAICALLIFEINFGIFIYFLLSSILAAYWLQHCRERKVFIKAGLKLGLFNMLLATIVDIYMADFLGFKLFWDWAFAFMGGMGAGIVTAGIVPLVEIAFNYTTDIKLLELANLDQPILRRLMIEAPGTYNHSVVIGTMVEAAASEIGANPLLARVCGYYHDIGKIKKPLYFIENQRDGINRHNKLAPSMSSLILTAHVKEGVDIAQKNKLGESIIDAIQQHHGTSLISFFYEKAKQLKGDDTVKTDDFRYPGPKPQTKEVGLVMLADVIEAASRTLENPTPSKIQGLVQNLINKVFSDGQLDECELTLKDLHKIAKSFDKILNGIYHHRIEYPDNIAVINGKAKNGSPDRQQTKQAQNIAGKNTPKSQGHLKRLGLS